MNRRLALTVITTGRPETHQNSHLYTANQTSHPTSNGKPGQAARRSLLSQVIHTFRVLSGRSTVDQAIPKHLPYECPFCGGVVFPKRKK